MTPRARDVRDDRACDLDERGDRTRRLHPGRPRAHRHRVIPAARRQRTIEHDRKRVDSAPQAQRTHAPSFVPKLVHQLTGRRQPARRRVSVNLGSK